AFLIEISTYTIDVAIDYNLYIKHFGIFFLWLFDDTESYIFTFLLTPFDEATFEVCFCRLQGMYIDMRFDDAREQEFFGEFVSFVQINRAEQCVKCISYERALFRCIAAHSRAVMA